MDIVCFTTLKRPLIIKNYLYLHMEKLSTSSPSVTDGILICHELAEWAGFTLVKIIVQLHRAKKSFYNL